jgi:hypothetical protein
MIQKLFSDSTEIHSQTAEMEDDYERDEHTWW